jgi:hypothetical protein
VIDMPDIGVSSHVPIVATTAALDYLGTRRVGVLLLAGCAAGCALPLPGGSASRTTEFVAGFARSDPEIGEERRIAPLLDLRTDGNVAGFHLGWSDLRVLERPSSTRTAETVQRGGVRFALPFGIEWTDERGVTSALGLLVRTRPSAEDDVLYEHTHLGAGFVAAPNGWRFSLGPGADAATVTRVGEPTRLVETGGGLSPTTLSRIAPTRTVLHVDEEEWHWKKDGACKAHPSR